MTSPHTKSPAAFTLIELLVVIAIIAILAAISLPVYSSFTLRATETKTLSNMRQFGAALLLYAGDNNSQLLNRAADGSNAVASQSKWPTQLRPYIPDTRAYTSPIPPVNGASYAETDFTKFNDNTINYTSYIYNGLNDMGAHADSTITPHLSLMDTPSQTIMFGIPYPYTYAVASARGQFYMDFADGDNNTVLNRTAFPNGCPYVFGDGSARMLVYNSDSATYKTSQPPSSATYSDWYWLVNKSAASASANIH